MLVLRFYSLTLGAGVVLCTYGVGRLTFPEQRGVGLGAAALVAYLPQHVAILASVNNDALAELLVALTLLVSALYLRLPGKTRLMRWHVALGVLVGLAFLTKTTAYFLVVIVVLAVLLRPLVALAASSTGRAAGTVVNVANALAAAMPETDRQRNRKSGWRTGRFLRSALYHAREVYAPLLRRSRNTLLRRLALVLGTAAAFGVVWWVRNSIVYGFPDVLGLGRHDVVVVGQLRTAERIAQVGGFEPYLRGAVQTTFNSFWGQFGWMALPLPTRAYTVIGAVLVLAGAGLIYTLVSAVRVSRGTPTAYQGAVGVLLAITGLLALAAFLYYNLTFYQVQGRYLFTALMPFALVFAAGLDAWARLLRRWLHSYADYIAPLLIAGGFGAFNLWLVRLVLPYLAP